jgi:outer membrane protein
VRSILLAGTAAIAAFAAVPATAQTQAGDVLARFRMIYVVPDESSGPVLPTFPGGGVSVGNSWAPELDFSYFLTNHLAAELILATTKHSIYGTGTLAPVGKLASTWVLPPTLTLQYHFNPKGPLRPYVGAGLNHTFFYSTKSSDELDTAIGSTRVHIDNNVGWAVQAGFDYGISPNLFLNFDFKYIGLNTQAQLYTGPLTNTVGIDLNPMVFGFGIGTRF